MTTWADTTIQAYGVYSLYYGIATASSGTDIAYEIASFAGVPDIRSPADVTEFVITENIGNGEYEGHAELTKAEGEVHTFDPPQRREVHYMLLGPAILREN